jgi:hypothetical protein
VSTENVVFNFFECVRSDVDYHNPATFIGSIIARDINLHSDFNIAGPSVNPIPVQGAFVLFLTGLLGLTFSRRKIGRPVNN